jgi:hypothetical protein
MSTASIALQSLKNVLVNQCTPGTGKSFDNDNGEFFTVIIL